MPQMALLGEPMPPQRNGRDKKSPDGRSSDRILIYKTRFDDRPSSRDLNGQTQKQAWQGIGTPVL
jgi:hypothetical protein